MTQTTTRKHLIVQHYNKLLLDIKKVYITEELLPNLEDFDICEILFYFGFYFPAEYVDDFNEPIKKIIEEKDIIITNTEYDLIYPLIKDFLMFYKSL
jgi:hypothetical protein